MMTMIVVIEGQQHDKEKNKYIGCDGWMNSHEPNYDLPQA